MLVYAFLALALVFSHGYSFYKGHNYANKDHIIRQQTAKIRHIEITNRYLREGNNKSESAASEANQSLAISETKLRKIEDDIKAGKLGKACSDQLFDELRRAR